MDISQVLVQFVFRLSFGLALAMGVTSPRLVGSGFYRIHLWVLMGLNTLAVLVLLSRRQATPYWRAVLALAVAAAVISYVGSVIWLYGKTTAGRWVIGMVSLIGLVAALLVQWRPEASSLATALTVLDVVSCGLLLGLLLAAMLLGHWYLNSPTMQLAPLKRLLLLVMAAIVVRVLICGVGLALEAGVADRLTTSFWLFVALRWLAGLVLTLPLALMTWQTLKIPNTQSATGILYAAVVVTIIGELTSQLLFVRAVYPL